MFSKNISSKFFIVTIFLFVQHIFAQQVQISSPDKTIQATFNKEGQAQDVLINGSWNRLSNDIEISDRDNKFYALDFSLGTYTHLITSNERPIYKISSPESNKIVLSSDIKTGNNVINVTRTITFLSNGQIRENLLLNNNSGQEIILNSEGIAFTFSSLFDISRATTNNSNIPEYQFYNGKKLQKASVNGGSWFGGPKPQDFIQNTVQWATIADNFFLFIADPKFQDTVIVYDGLEFGAKSRVNLGIQVLATNISPRSSLSYDIDYYIGPRHESIVKTINPEYKKMFAWPVVFNWMLKPIESGTTAVMSFLVSKTGSAGLTLILIAVLVKLLLLPLSIKSAISMKKMRILQPKLNKLQEKWGHDPQTLQIKTMELYKEEKANPLGGCLPLLLQIPVFFALFRVLSRSVELRGANFLWIKDLTMPDSLFMIGTFSFNLLPIIMTILQIASVFLQQGRVGGSQNEMQKQMQTQSYFMPLIFLFLFWNMPSGLVLYWTVQNIFSIFEQEAINLDSRIGKKSL